MEMLCTHEYDKQLGREDHGEGPNVFTFLNSAFVIEIRSQTLKEILGLEKAFFRVR